MKKLLLFLITLTCAMINAETSAATIIKFENTGRYFEAPGEDYLAISTDFVGVILTDNGGIYRVTAEGLSLGNSEISQIRSFMIDGFHIFGSSILITQDMKLWLIINDPDDGTGFEEICFIEDSDTFCDTLVTDLFDVPTSEKVWDLIKNGEIENVYREYGIENIFKGNDIISRINYDKFISIVE